jgi:hypothetical protein
LSSARRSKGNFDVSDAFNENVTPTLTTRSSPSLLPRGLKRRFEERELLSDEEARLTPTNSIPTTPSGQSSSARRSKGKKPKKKTEREIQKRKEAKREKRKRVKETRYKEGGHSASAKALEAHVKNAESTSASVKLSNLPVANGAFEALYAGSKGVKSTPDLNALLENGYKYVSWDGR